MGYSPNGWLRRVRRSYSKTVYILNSVTPAVTQ